MSPAASWSIAALLGAAVGAGGMALLRPGSPPPQVAGVESAMGDASSSAGSRDEREPCVPPPAAVLEAMAPPKVKVATTGWGAPFASGTFVLRLGDGYVFGEDRSQPGAEPETVDIVCDDLAERISVHCPHGARAPSLPLGAVGVPDDPAKAAMLLVDAPPAMPQRRTTFETSPRVGPQAVAMVKSKDGAVFKVWLLEYLRDPSALARAARFAYESLPVAADGGVLRVAAARPVDGSKGPTTETLRELAEIGRSIPGDSFAGFLQGRYERLASPSEPLTVVEGRHLLLEGPLRAHVHLDAGGSVYAQDGIAAGGEVSFDAYSGVAVRGPMAGKISVKSYGFLHLAGDLVGEVDCDSYTTVVIDGDIRGTLRLRSYVNLLLRGRILGSLDPKGACWSTFYWQGFHSRDEVAALPGDFRQITLHLERSDAPDGTIEPAPGKFREAFVGDKAWEKMRR